MEKNTKEFIRKLLERKPEKRLGYNGWEEV
jgi:hypothetical protein